MIILEYLRNLYARLYFKIHDFLADHNLFYYWQKKVEIKNVCFAADPSIQVECYQCPYCHRVMEK